MVDSSRWNRRRSRGAKDRSSVSQSQLLLPPLPRSMLPRKLFRLDFSRPSYARRNAEARTTLAIDPRESRLPPSKRSLRRRQTSRYMFSSSRCVARLLRGPFADCSSTQDNLINQKVMQRQLKLQKFEVTLANHGQEALDILLAAEAKGATVENPIGIILMDIEVSLPSVAWWKSRADRERTVDACDGWIDCDSRDSEDGGIGRTQISLRQS